MEFDEVYSDVVDKLTTWADTLASMLPNLMVAILVIVVFWFIARLTASATNRTLKRAHTHEAARGLISRFVRIGVLVAGVVVALGVLNLDKALASILAGAGILGLALGFAFQDLAGNLISGIGLAVNQKWPFKIGDIVETNDIFGTVDKIHLRTSIIKTLDGKVVVIPNKTIYQNAVINHTSSGHRRVDVVCGVSYGDDLNTVRKVATEALNGLSERDISRDVEVYFEAFGDSSINFVGRFWIEYERHPDFLSAKSNAIVALKEAFDGNDIMIPFPIRTLDFGIRGGEPLAEAFPSSALRDSNGAKPLDDGDKERAS
ncbi:MAG: mechanosensitive ion channel [Polyangiales bacterium]